MYNPEGHNVKEDLKDIKFANYPAFIVKAEVEQKSESGDIILPQSSDDEEEKIFDVEKAGDNCKHIKEGDRILLRDSTKPIATLSRNGNKYMIFEELSVVIIFEDDAGDDNQ